MMGWDEVDGDESPLVRALPGELAREARVAEKRSGRGGCLLDARERSTPTLGAFAGMRDHVA